jgi:uncharacterized protein
MVFEVKINQDLHVKMEKLTQDSRQVQAGSGKFQQLVQKQDQKMQFDTLNRLFGDIQSVGERLSKSRNFRDLAKFKSLVKRFVRESVEFGMDLKQSHSWSQYGQSRPLKIVETIDEKLLELTDEVMRTEKSSIDILGKIGEIKGLLINLYT